MIEHLPGRPAPEVHVQVAQVPCVYADAPFWWWHPRLERCWLGRVLAARLDPAATPPCPHLVGWIANHDGDRLISLDLICLPARFSDWLEHCRNPLLLNVGVAQCVRNEHSRRCCRRGSNQVRKLSE